MGDSHLPVCSPLCRAEKASPERSCEVHSAPGRRGYYLHAITIPEDLYICWCTIAGALV